jgi:hypothetical protein
MFHNLTLSLASFAGLFLIKKLEAYLQTTRFNYLNSSTGFIKLFLLYTAHKHLTALRFPLTGFPLFIFDRFITAYGISYSLSIITFIVGYPILTSLHYYSQFAIDRTLDWISTNHLMVNNQRVQMAYGLQVLTNFCEALVSNHNWSLSYGTLILKSHAPRFTEAFINERCPLRASNTRIETDIVCSICMEPIKERELHRQLPCNHWFHAPCGDAWLMVHGTCPNCRREI